RHRADEGRFAGVREPEQADVGQHLQFQLQFACLAWRAGSEAARRAVGGTLEMDVAETALAALRHQQLLPMRGEVADQFVGIEVEHGRADRHADHRVLAAAAVHVAAHAILAALRLELTLVAEVDQRVQAFVRDQPHAAAFAAVATVGTAERNELLAPEAGTAVPAVAGLHLDDGFVDEFHGRPGSAERTACKRNKLSSFRRRPEPSDFPARVAGFRIAAEAASGMTSKFGWLFKRKSPALGGAFRIQCDAWFSP